jgi:hypothetical protein
MRGILETIDGVDTVQLQHAGHAEAKTKCRTILACVEQQQLSPTTIGYESSSHQRTTN